MNVLKSELEVRNSLYKERWLLRANVRGINESRRTLSLDSTKKVGLSCDERLCGLLDAAWGTR